MEKLTHLCSLILLLAVLNCSGEPETSPSRTIDIYGIDKMKFVVAEKQDGLQTGNELTVSGKTYYILEGITARTGQKLTINLTTISDLPASAMSHNWLLLKKSADAELFSKASLQAKGNDYVAEKMESLMITDTGLVTGGKTKSTTFTAPGQTGDYEFICTLPGHFTAGMRGTLTVE